MQHAPSLTPFTFPTVVEQVGFFVRFITYPRLIFVPIIPAIEA
jgi:hypothetical protein